ncbi:MAG: PEGA domain-containing protein [bacterium]|nr:PEGA domain-containing protein [bacterium]
MTLKKRFFLVGFGIILFAIIAPAIVLFARGYYFDWQNFRIVATGILSIKTEPRDVEIYLNGKFVEVTQKPIRFLLSGEYEVVLKKDGYLPWKKRIRIYDDLVTNLPESSDKKIYLFKETKIQSAISTTTRYLLENERGVFFLEKDNIFHFDMDYTTKTLVATTSQATISSQDIGDEAVAPKAGIAIPVPGRRPYLILDNILYEDSENRKKINDSVNYAFWNAQAKMLVYGNTHDIWILEPEKSQDSRLITRSTKILGVPAFNPLTYYLFVSEDKEIKAVEVDSLGQPNVYTLATIQNQNVKLAVNSNGSRLLYLDGQNLYVLKFR